MTDRPILFSGPMVRAQLEDRKTQTRRLPTRLLRFGKITEFGPSDTPGYDWHFRDKAMRWHDLRHDELLKVLPWQNGDRLWVRETLNRPNGSDWRYAADDAPVELTRSDPRVAEMVAWAHHKEGDVCVSIHMPRWASRLTLTVTDVRVQRLQEISEADCIAEGIDVVPDNYGNGPAYRDYGMAANVDTAEWYARPIDSYRSLWVEINGAANWIDNPRVAAVSFTVEHRNIDSIEKAAA